MNKTEDINRFVSSVEDLKLTENNDLQRWPLNGLAVNM
jgi:hypothetical protein